MKLSTLLGDYPQTHLVRSGERRAASFEFDFADVKVPNRGFKRTVRDLEFDASELALVTFLQARAYGKPLVALPITIVGRPQHQCIVYNAERGLLDPAALAGKRIGARAYAQTTVTWVRGMLVEEYGLDVSEVQWITFEHGHLSEYPDPAWCERAEAAWKELSDGEPVCMAVKVAGAFLLAGALFVPLWHLIVAAHSGGEHVVAWEFAH